MQDFFHNNLRRARERAGISQAKMADDIGIGRTTYFALESGRTRLFSKHVDRIATYLGISPEELLCGFSAESLLRDQAATDEWKNAVVDSYEKRIEELLDKLDAAHKLNAALQANVDSLTESQRFLLSQLRKEP